MLHLLAQKNLTYVLYSTVSFKLINGGKGKGGLGGVGGMDMQKLYFVQNAGNIYIANNLNIYSYRCG